MTDIIPCKKRGRTTIAFVVEETETEAFILDNYVWAIHAKPIPIEEWRKDWAKVVVPEDKLQKILLGLKNYALYAGITAEAMCHLKLMVTISNAEEQVALDKGCALLAKYKTQAAAEASADGKKALAGAALQSKLKGLVVENTGSEPGNQPEILAEPGTSNNATESGERAGDSDNDSSTALARRRIGSDKAQKIRELAAEVTKDLNEVEAAGENPTKLTKGIKSQAVNAAVSKVRAKKVQEEKAARKAAAPPFDATKLKDENGVYKSVSAMFKGLILEGKLSDDKIFAEVKKQFGLDDSKRGYVRWNRNWLVKEGVISNE